MSNFYWQLMLKIGLMSTSIILLDQNFNANDVGIMVFGGRSRDFGNKTHGSINPYNVNPLYVSGWIHSGDIGKWLPNGTLKIIDRKKNFFKLAQGEYISSEKVENVFITHHLIDNIYIYGDGLKSYLVAIVDFNETAVRKFLETKREEINTEKRNQGLSLVARSRMKYCHKKYCFFQRVFGLLGF